MAASMMRLQRDDASLDCPCADCLNQVPPRTMASLSPWGPTAADLYVMKLHEEAIHNSHSDQFSHASSSTPGLFGYNNGIIVGDPVWPKVGAYVRQCIVSVPKGTHLPWYWTPPSDRSARLPPLYRGLAAGTIFGPVHQVEDTLDKGGFISVLVPPPLCKVPREDRETLPDLVWINIFTNRRKGREVRHHYCRVVAKKKVAMWRRLGWKDVWIEKGQTLFATSWNTLQPAPSSASRLKFFGLLAE